MSFRGGRTLWLPPASVSAYLSLCGGWGVDCLSLVQLGEWMPSSASGGNDQSFISFLQCQSLQPSILEPESQGECAGPFRQASCHKGLCSRGLFFGLLESQGRS